HRPLEGLERDDAIDRREPSEVQSRERRVGSDVHYHSRPGDTNGIYLPHEYLLQDVEFLFAANIYLDPAQPTEGSPCRVCIERNPGVGYETRRVSQGRPAKPIRVNSEGLSNGSTMTSSSFVPVPCTPPMSPPALSRRHPGRHEARSLHSAGGPRRPLTAR